MKNERIENPVIVTAGANYLDIDAYACMVALAELLQLKGENGIAYSQAPCNYSVCSSLLGEGQVFRELPPDLCAEEASYIIVDVSDPDFLKGSVPIDRVREVYDHHVGFEDYWQETIGSGTHIEFIGAAATLIYREWKKANLQDKLSHKAALLLIAAILDNTLNLTSTNTTAEDRAVFHELCVYTGVGDEFRADYFSQVQECIEADLQNAMFNDIKTVRNNVVLPTHVAQLCIWNADSILSKLSQIRGFFKHLPESWMINLIDLEHQCSYFICDDQYHQNEIERVFDVHFEAGVAKSSISYLRKEIIKKTLSPNIGG